MKTILFLHREELTELFAGIINASSGRFNVINVAYSPKEQAVLLKHGINSDFVYTTLLAKELGVINKADSALLAYIDNFIIGNTKGRFTLNGAIQSDRGFSLLNYEEALRLAQANYTLWKKIFHTGHIDLFIHELTSLFFNHIASLLCRAQGGIFLTQIMVFSETDEMAYMYFAYDDATCPEMEKAFGFYKTNSDKVDIERCQTFIRKFRASYEIFQQNFQLKTSYFRILKGSIKRRIAKIIKRNRFDRLTQNIDYWLNMQDPMSNRLQNLSNYRRCKIIFQEPIEGEKYYYYSIHLEPEAALLYLGDGIYTNQIKLIENIAASLPAGYYLYVKDHPHEYAYRCAEDYLRLTKIPNIRLLRSTIPGKRLIKDAVGVFTINGTAGFEGVMLGKQVYCFGKSYYTCSNRVTYIHNIRDLRGMIYKNIGKEYTDDIDFLAFVNGYLDSLHPGMVDFFMGRAESYGIDLDLNARRIADDLFNFAETFCS
jgi:hypothetical protein